MRTHRLWGCGLVLIMSVVGCSGVGDASDPPPVGASAGLGDAPVVSSSPVVSASPAVTSSPAVVVRAAFKSPSGNIGCYVDKDGARCDIGKKAWEAPPTPADCDLDWAAGISVYRAEPAAFTCAGDTVMGAREVLEYGESVRAGDFTCGSDRKAMRCENTVTGHGFTLSVQQYHVF